MVDGCLPEGKPNNHPKYSKASHQRHSQAFKGGELVEDEIFRVASSHRRRVSASTLPPISAALKLRSHPWSVCPKALESSSFRSETHQRRLESFHIASCEDVYICWSIEPKHLRNRVQAEVRVA